MSSLYTNKGLYNGYKKNHKEREALDYYATAPQEVLNILQTLSLNMDNSTILEPCVGGGHMLLGIQKYLEKCNYKSHIIATDIQDRRCSAQGVELQYRLDFLDDYYPYDKVDFVIMNPPYSTIEPFVLRGLEIATKGLLVLARLQFLESQGRYEKIFKIAPPSQIWVYVDRISCYKNGDFSIKDNSAQAYAWFYWNILEHDRDTKMNWIRRSEEIVDFS